MPTEPNSKLPQRPREMHSRRKAIASAIRRRIHAAESLSIRAIIAEAGGGSTDTVREELRKAEVDEAARLLKGDKIASAAEREAVLRQQLERAQRWVEILREENEALRKALQAASLPSSVVEHQVADIGREVRNALEGLHREATLLRRVREKGREQVFVPDQALQVRFNRLASDNDKLLQRYSRLRARHFELTGEDFDE